MFKPTGTPQPQKRYKDAHGALVTVESVSAVAVELLSIRIDVTFQDEALYFLAISAMVSSRTVGDADTDETLICFRIILSSALVENAITPDNSVANKTDFLNI